MKRNYKIDWGILCSQKHEDCNGEVYYKDTCPTCKRQQADSDRQVESAIAEHLEQFIADMEEAFDTDRDMIIKVLGSTPQREGG